MSKLSLKQQANTCICCSRRTRGEKLCSKCEGKLSVQGYCVLCECKRLDSKLKKLYESIVWQ